MMQLKLPISLAKPGAVRWVPAEYQKTVVRFMVKHPESMILLDPGLRKTSCALAAFIALRKAGGVRKMLVVAPLRVAELVWSKYGELGKWLDFSSLTVALVHGPPKQRLAALAQDADLYTVNYEGVMWMAENGHLADLARRGVDVLVLDELSKVKHTRTKRFRALKPHLGRFKRRWGLTGSPCSNGLEDLFGETYAIDLGRHLGQYITHYRCKYFDPCGYKGYEWKPKPGAEKLIYAQLKDIALSMRAEDHLDLPEMVEENIYVDLPPKARKAYDDLEDELITALEEGVVVAANAAVASGKCRQVASGGIYLEDAADARKKHSVFIHDEKTEALKDLVEELQGSPLLVAYDFHHDLERMRNALGAKLPAINGDTSMRESAALATAWNRGELPVLAGQPQACGHGLNLQECGHHIVWYTPTFNYEVYDQMNRRVYRSGQKNRVVIHRILARKTIDELVARALLKKGKGQDDLLNALKNMRKSR
jgi:SNF2 family DNA or RNA helicase